MRRSRATPRRSASRGMIDRDYRRRVRRLRCAARGMGPCGGRIEADHVGKKPGFSMKCNDKLCVPLCKLHHAHRTSKTGPFFGWSVERQVSWRKEKIRETQLELLGSVDEGALLELDLLLLKETW